MKMKQRGKNSAAIQKLSLPVPTQEDWDNLVEELKLKPAQARALAITLEHLSTDLAQQQERRAAAPRDRLVTRLRRMEKLFSALLAEMERARADMIHFMPSESLAEIGRAMTFEAIRDALGRDVMPKRLKDEVQSKIGQVEEFSPAEFDKITSSAREALGLKHGDIILQEFLNRIYEPMRLWFERDKQFAHGKPALLLRRHLVYALAQAAPEIIGRKAGVGEAGPFVRLCAGVLRSLRLSDHGVEKIVPDIVRQLRKDQGTGTGPKPARKRKPRARK